MTTSRTLTALAGLALATGFAGGPACAEDTKALASAPRASRR